jgi:hypothetical protein
MMSLKRIYSRAPKAAEEGSFIFDDLSPRLPGRF